MPTPAVTLKLKKFRRHFGITASRVVVRSHLPWQWLGVLALALFISMATVIWLVLQGNEAGVMGREMEGLRQQLQVQGEELKVLRSAAGTNQNAVSIERAAQQQLLVKLEGLERENGALKEDILVFERLIPAVGDDAVIRVENFRVMRDLGGRYQFRLLLAFQPAKQSPEFRGDLQLAVSFLLAGKEQLLLLPDKRAANADYGLELKHFLRREGFFELPSGAELKAVEARVLQGGTLKAKRLAQL